MGDFINNNDFAHNGDFNFGTGISRVDKYLFIASTSVPISHLNFNLLNTQILYQIGNPILTYKPGRVINGFREIVADKKYYGAGLLPLDISNISVDTQSAQ